MEMMSWSEDTEDNGQLSGQSQGAYCEHVFIMNNTKRELELDDSYDMFTRPIEQVCDKNIENRYSKFRSRGW